MKKHLVKRTENLLNPPTGLEQMLQDLEVLNSGLMNTNSSSGKEENLNLVL